MDLDPEGAGGDGAVNGQSLHQGRIGGDPCSAVHAQGRVQVGHQKYQLNPWVLDDVAQAVDAVIATSLGQHQGSLVDDAHQRGRISTLRGVQDIGTAGGQHGKPSARDPMLIDRVQVIGSLAQGVPGGGLKQGAKLRFRLREGLGDVQVDWGHTIHMDPAGPPIRPASSPRWPGASSGRSRRTGTCASRPRSTGWA